MASTRHCHKCGWDWPLSAAPGRTESCHQCGSDIKVCLNCAHYDTKAAYQCRDRRSDPVQDKHTANFCEYFEFARREWAGTKSDSREQAARDKMKKLFGD